MYTITHIRETSRIQLEPASVIAAALNGTQPVTSAVVQPVAGILGADAGIWECTPGSWRRATPHAEVMHFLSGECTFTPDGAEPMHIRTGDTVIFPTHTKGTWVVISTIRKVYVTLATATV
ncbi:DUF861 domain-containing protein [Variovorax sp. KBS0712]|jgi:uncharacterized cupin superfamily protein|uniref:cupin domain-containing protein n=1 Tax=Variovorax sp. KBS0712 TaxID=2578111 RepID=UPI00111BA4BC|nr:cupin domain-containing protein [Variovorax sp. KBS0712]TSD56900.1 DUF861 domain-containing protein [Variovorax sp. KBS0712]